MTLEEAKEKASELFKDYKIEKATNAYNEILQYDMTELNELVSDVCIAKRICRNRTRFILKRMKDSNLIFPIFNISLLDIIKTQIECIKRKNPIYDKIIMCLSVYQDNIVSIENIARRLLTLHERTQTHILTKFDMDNIELLKKYDKKEMLQTLMWLQRVFIDRAEIMIVDKRIPIVYNKINYYIMNLGRLLLLEITDRYEFIEKSSFVIKIGSKVIAMCFQSNLKAKM